MTVATDE